MEQAVIVAEGALEHVGNLARKADSNAIGMCIADILCLL